MDVPVLPATGEVDLTSWYNISSWAVNVTRYTPSLEDLVWAGPRVVRKLGSLVAPSLGEPIDPYHVHESMNRPATQGLGTADTNANAPRTVDSTHGLGSVFSYATSKWAMSCIAMAIILNRTHVFAATRRRIRLRWPTRLLIRAVPVCLLFLQARSLLQSIQCQTSAEFSELRWGDPDKSSDLMFAHPNALLNRLSSTFLLGSTDEQSCQGVAMIQNDDLRHDLQGSLSRLWPLFGTFCLSQFLETVSCAVQGRPVAAETGMTLFEQSLAFAEADAAVSNQLGWGAFAPAKSSGENAHTLIAYTRSTVLKRVNTAPEVLLIAFFATMTHLTSHVLGIFGLQAKLRLINTGFWGLCIMGNIVWSIAIFDLEDPSTQGLLRYPTVCIIGFSPHVLVLAGILSCLFVYGLALGLSAIASSSSPELAGLSFRQRLAYAHENMQANVSLSEIRITREMDFYTALIRTGFAAISMASEAVYLNEDRGVSLKRHTWLEEARLKEAEELQRKWIGTGLPGAREDAIGAMGLVPVKGGPLIASNGFARERAAQEVTTRTEKTARAGIGATERSSRWLMAIEFTMSIASLFSRLSALACLWILTRLRLRSPAWLHWLARRPKSVVDTAEPPHLTQDALSFNANGRIPRTDGIDIEREFRRIGHHENEEALDSDLYNYWLKGGWWGSADSSKDFTPGDDWDTTSVVSMSTNANSDDGWESDDGQRTPTQQSPNNRSRATSPVVDSPLSMTEMARLLHPASKTDREDAEALSAHLQSDTIVTRSGFRRLEVLKRSRVLSRHGDTSILGAGRRTMKLDPEEEERLLEQLLLSHRQPEATTKTNWREGASGMGDDGPQCVVCQSSPRTIIVWPCRCLSLCDDCRVSLAMNNFDKCVCCRREVISFSRIFVP